MDKSLVVSLVVLINFSKLDKMGKTKDPPPFMMDKPYEQWKTEIKAWMYTADAADKNKAI